MASLQKDADDAYLEYCLQFGFTEKFLARFLKISSAIPHISTAEVISIAFGNAYYNCSLSKTVKKVFVPDRAKAFMRYLRCLSHMSVYDAIEKFLDRNPKGGIDFLSHRPVETFTKGLKIWDVDLTSDLRFDLDLPEQALFHGTSSSLKSFDTGVRDTMYTNYSKRADFGEGFYLQDTMHGAIVTALSNFHGSLIADVTLRDKAPFVAVYVLVFQCSPDQLVCDEHENCECASPQRLVLEDKKEWVGYVQANRSRHYSHIELYHLREHMQECCCVSGQTLKYGKIFDNDLEPRVEDVVQQNSIQHRIGYCHDEAFEKLNNAHKGFVRILLRPEDTEKLLAHLAGNSPSELKRKN